MDLKLIAVVISVFIGLVAPLPYIKDIYFGKTRPHIFTWLIWTILVGAAFWGQVVGGAGLGSLALGITALMNVVILVSALIKSRDYINNFDVVILCLTLLAFIPWWLMDDPVSSILLLAVIDFLAFLPTVRKSIKNPEMETISIYSLSALKHIVSLFALYSYNILTLTFPVMLIVTNALMVIFVVIRRKVIAGA